MTVMTASEIFWQQMGAFNEATIVVQILLATAAIFLAILVFLKPGSKTNVLMKIFLAFAFGWNAIAYFGISAPNPISLFIGAPLFIFIAILFIVDIFSQKTVFQAPQSRWRKITTILWIVLAMAYPVIGFIIGHRYPQVCLPMAPCPLTIYTIALMAAAIPKVNKTIYIALIPWALLGLPKCLGMFECYEDCLLFGAGVYGLIMLVKSWKSIDNKGKIL